MTADLALKAHERRSDLRLPSNALGRIWYGRNVEFWADCRLRNLSRGGAKIEVPALYQLPSRLILAYRGDDALYETIVKWRQGDAVGLAFERRHSLVECGEPRFEPIVRSWKALVGLTDLQQT